MPSVFGPFSSGSITFEVGNNSEWIEDPETGNYIPGPGNIKKITYQVSVTLSPSSSNNAPGTELVQYSCQGRLLRPTTFDPRISVGMVADATLNGLQGRLVIQDLGMNMEPSYRSTLRQQFSGLFEQVGAGTLLN